MPEKRRTPDSLRVVGDRIRVQISDLVAAYRAADIEGMVPFFAPDVVFMPADRPGSSGVPALRRYLERTFAQGGELVALGSDHFVAADEVAVERGTYHRRIPRADGATTDEIGRYELTWRLQDDGEYRVTSWIFTRAAHSPNGSRPF
jgi:ketosteroid isomerase-like protein